MAAYAALVSLMNNIEQIQRHTRLPISLNKNRTEPLLEKVKFLIDFLESYNFHADRKEVRGLESRIREAAYAAEDIIETHVVETINDYSRSKKGKEQFPTISSRLPGMWKLLREMDIIMEEVTKMKELMNEISDLKLDSPITVGSLPSVPVGKNTTVGFDGELNRVVERLTARERSRQVITIVGMGGIGKTTLAKSAYEKPYVVKHFDFCAWVSISQEYDLKKIILGLLPNESDQSSGNELGQRLHKRLYGRRYLVVLDDMWSLGAWDMIKLFLPDNSNGSRIIVTTRASSVATYLDSSSLEMNFLDEDNSWNLFCAKVFGQEGCPLELEAVGRKIVKNCKGLPLSIVVIGGLLRKSERKKIYWEYIAANTIEIISSENNEHCMKILSLSYQSLPVYLKPCYLYIGAFPEDTEIRTSVLIKLWVAEGFLKSDCSKELDVLGEEYLNDLIGRNLILVHKRGLNGKIKSCMIHDLLRDICLKEAQDGKFMSTPKMCSHDELHLISSHRHISLHPVESNEKYIPQVFDTLKSGSMGRSLLCDKVYEEVLPLQKFKLLRVLKCYETFRKDIFGYSPIDIFRLVNSRFIAITVSVDTKTFPSSVCLLWNLQTLIVRGIIYDVVLPLEFWGMTELRHVQILGAVRLLDPPPSQQTDAKEGDCIMKNIHTIKKILDFRLSYEVVKRIQNIKKLAIRYDKHISLKYLSLLENLESLYLTFNESLGSYPLSHLTFPNSLKKLVFDGCYLHWEDMPIIGSLPHLEVLKLKMDSFVGPKWILVEGGFLCLKYLNLGCSDLVHWIADDTHFPCLEHLVLSELKKLTEIPSGIGDIPTLQEIELFLCSTSVAISAKEILGEQENLGNVGLRVKVIYKKDAKLLESLASDNFLLDYWPYDE